LAGLTFLKVVILVLIVIGILLLAARDVLYSAAAWSSTELTVAVVAWDAWVRMASCLQRCL
jgi:hypothetical protein